MRVTDRAAIANEGGRALTVILAPSSREYRLLPGAAVVVEAEGPAGDRAELLVERTCDTVVAWAWPGADLRLLAPDGRRLMDWEASPGVARPPEP